MLQDQIFSHFAKFQKEPLNCEGWDDSLHVRVLYGTDMDHLRDLMSDDATASEIECLWVALAVCDPEGSPVFDVTSKDTINEMLEKIPHVALSEAAERVAEVNHRYRGDSDSKNLPTTDEN